jgi:hypothetical protein
MRLDPGRTGRVRFPGVRTYYDRTVARWWLSLGRLHIAIRIGAPWFGHVRWRVPRLDRVHWRYRVLWHNRYVAQQYREAAVRSGRG